MKASFAVPRSGAVLLALSLLLATVLAYWPATRFGFSSLDDGGYVFQNPLVTGGLTLGAVRRAFASPHLGYWIPATWLSYMVDVELGGLDPFVFHRTNILLHAANALLVFWLLHRATGALWCSAAVALLFSVHPLRVESVVWITERKDVLSTFFLLLSLALYGRHVHEPSPLRYAGCLSLWTLAALAKPSVVVFPLLLVLLDIWPLGRYPWGARPTALRLVADKGVPLVLAAGLAALTVWTQYHFGSFGRPELLTPAAARPWWASVTQPPQAFLLYAAQLFWPVCLGVQGAPPAWRPFDTAGFALSIGLLSPVTLFAWRGGRARPYLAVGWLWYLAALVPNSGVVGVGTQWLADRFTYLPHLGLLVALVWGTASLTTGRPIARTILGSLALGAFVALFALTRLQVAHWRSNEALFAHSVAVLPGNWYAHLFLGQEYAGSGRPAQAVEQFRLVTLLNPGNADGHYNLGLGLAATGRVAEAVAPFQEALDRNPADADAHYNLGVALAQLGRPSEAATHYRETLRLEPGRAAAHRNLGSLLAGLGRPTDALPHFREAARLSPSDADARYDLGVALASLGRPKEAAAAFGEALRLRPDDSQTAFNLGFQSFEIGDFAGAVEAFSRARVLNPRGAATLYNLSAAHQALGHGATATALRREALRLRPNLLTDPGQTRFLCRRP